jgi:hypothetical protein
MFCNRFYEIPLSHGFVVVKCMVVGKRLDRVRKLNGLLLLRYYCRTSKLN